jgi:hypothetical protein
MDLERSGGALANNRPELEFSGTRLNSKDVAPTGPDYDSRYTSSAQSPQPQTHSQPVQSSRSNQQNANNQPRQQPPSAHSQPAQDFGNNRYASNPTPVNASNISLNSNTPSTESTKKDRKEKLKGFLRF